MITFSSINVDDMAINWTFEKASDIEKIWNSDNPDLPANDDICFNVCLDGTPYTLVPKRLTFIELLDRLGIDTGLPKTPSNVPHTSVVIDGIGQVDIVASDKPHADMHFGDYVLSLSISSMKEIINEYEKLLL